MLVGDFLGAVLVDRMVVAGDQRLVNDPISCWPMLFAFDRLRCEPPAIPSRMSRSNGSIRRMPMDRVVDVVVAGRVSATRWPMPGDTAGRTMNSSSVATSATSPRALSRSS